jgi:hypothetical protein
MDDFDQPAGDVAGYRQSRIGDTVADAGETGPDCSGDLIHGTHSGCTDVFPAVFQCEAHVFFRLRNLGKWMIIAFQSARLIGCVGENRTIRQSRGQTKEAMPRSLPKSTELEPDSAYDAPMDAPGSGGNQRPTPHCQR